MKHRSQRAFSLIELLVVVCIMGLLMGIAIPSISSLMESTNLTSAGQMVVDQIGLARQMASTMSTTVEVRIIQLSPDSEGFNAVQIWAPSPKGMTPAKRMARLPNGMVISDSSGARSPLLTLLAKDQMPSYGLAADAPFLSFYIRPSGAVVTDLPANTRSDHYLSIVSEKKIVSGKLPANYITIQLNPETGTTSIYTP